VFAVGDAARWFSPFYGRSVRVEHWTNAVEQAGVVAARILGAAPPSPSAPYAWSDQYGARFQLVGLPGAESPEVVYRSADQRSVVATYSSRGTLIAAFAMNAPRAILWARQLIATRASLEDARTSLLALA
jgi:NADPH-dependent 2,4-dienoyl-CoA reductase/sulfur reductase-like enzyme